MHYGARGITVCPQWLNNYDRFFADMGEAPEGFSLERKNNDLGYTPTNCVWATLTDQLNNQRRNVRFTLDGQTLTVSQWATKLKVNYDTLWRRLRSLKMSPERALVSKSLKDVGWDHGTRTGYEYGCRCPDCKSFNTQRARLQRARRA